MFFNETSFLLCFLGGFASFTFILIALYEDIKFLLIFPCIILALIASHFMTLEPIKFKSEVKSEVRISNNTLQLIQENIIKHRCSDDDLKFPAGIQLSIEK